MKLFPLKPLAGFLCLGVLFSQTLQAQFTFQNWVAGNTTYTETQSGVTMTVNVTGGANFNAGSPTYNSGGVPSPGTGLALDHNWANLSSVTTVTISFSSALASPTFSINDINRNNPCAAFCSAAWTDRVTVATNVGTVTATSPAPSEHTITNNGTSAVTVEGNSVCSGTNAAVSFAVAGSPTVITVTYRSGATVQRSTASSPNLCGTVGGETNCRANLAACSDPGRQFITIGPIPAPILPITLLHFAAETEGATHWLQWSTSGELADERIYVERGQDGHTFAAISDGHVVGTQQADGSKAYAFCDKRPLPGVNYYRLLLVDMDGSSTHSRTVAVEPAAQAAFVLAPNPAKDRLTLVSQSSDEVELLLCNAMGQVVKVVAGSGQINLDVADLPAGTYFARCQNWRSKVIIAH
jgi:hypothetical protein